MHNQSIYFWQRIVTPHMAFLAESLAKQGWSVVYVANQQMSSDRARQGWQSPNLKEAQIKIAPDAQSVGNLVTEAPSDSIHICQGIRANGLVGVAQHFLAKRGLKQWVVMESVDDAGWTGLLKQLIYRYHFGWKRKHISGVLATGKNTSNWVVSRGVDKKKVFPFAYFLETPQLAEVDPNINGEKFRLIFVGQLIARKRVDLLINAVAALNQANLELVIIGSGPLEQNLRRHGDRLLPGRIHWKGRLPMDSVPSEIASADCLILPSRHDGWGAVVAEALMVGTPVVCSDACGAAAAVEASGVGGVFISGDLDGLTCLLRQYISKGKVSFSMRGRIQAWASALGADAGARYLGEILRYVAQGGEKPVAPWIAPEHQVALK